MLAQAQGFQGAKSSLCIDIEGLQVKVGEGRGTCIKLTLSGMQENFSEIINGTPSTAAREEREERIEDTTAVQQPRMSAQRGPITPWLEADAAQLK